MRITWVEFENFRSIEHLRIEGLDRPTVIFEGPNDVGKSNIVEGLDLAVRAVAKRWITWEGKAPPSIWSGNESRTPDDNFRYQSSAFRVAFNLRLDPHDAPPGHSGLLARDVECSVRFDRKPNEAPEVTVESVKTVPKGSVGTMPDLGLLLSDAFILVQTSRLPKREKVSFAGGHNLEQQMLWTGDNLKQVLFAFKNHPSLEIQDRFNYLLKVLNEESPAGGLKVGALNVAVQGDGNLRVRTRVNGGEMDLESRGTGVQQFVTLLALATCNRGRILAIEEPELNLSVPNQRALWSKLRQFAADGGFLDQIFVTSHSGVFEEEAERFIVSRDAKGATQVAPAPPRPALHDPDEQLLPVKRSGEVTLPAEVLERLGIKPEEHAFLIPDPRGGYRLLGPREYTAASLGRDGSDDADR